MTRTRLTWLLFALCLLVIFAAMGWVSLAAVRLERSERDVRRLQVVEENVRLALWRMDSAVAPLIAQESARPYFVFSAFYPAERAYNRMYNEIQHGEVLVPSPLLTSQAPHVLLYFQVGPDGAITSPQVPTGNMRGVAESNYTSRERIETAAARLADLRRRMDRRALMAALRPPAEDTPEGSLGFLFDPWLWQNAGANEPGMLASGPQADQPVQQPRQFPNSEAPNQQVTQVLRNPFNRKNYQDLQQEAQQSQKKLNVDNYQARGKSLAVASNSMQAANGMNLFQYNNTFFALDELREGMLRPVWIGEALFLARRVRVAGAEYVQGCWLDWPAIRQMLLADARELLPAATLMPVSAEGMFKPDRMLASLPVRLEPGPLPVAVDGGLTLIGLSLAVAWVCVLLAAGAGAWVVAGALSLSERRGAFVSAVTHELRTPLTTFRMYTEMLSEGMIVDEERKRQYLDTLRTESVRLGHLVENVLSYARLERGRAAARMETLTLEELVARQRERLTARVEQSGMKLVLDAGDAWAAVVHVDVSSVEQVLFNLVDNAAKYASRAEDKRVNLTAGRTDGRATIAVRDHGPGIDPKRGERLFRAFHKSARDAANSAPGIGLGLALSRRLARSIGGDLRLDPTTRDGACFVLLLPVSGD